MIHARIYLERSSIPGAGIGVFSGEDIARGALVWEFNPAATLVYTTDEWEKMKKKVSPQAYEQIEIHAYKADGKYHLSLDGSQYMNHSQESFNLLFDRTKDILVASRDIKKGEELLCNYFDYSDEDDYNCVILKKLMK